MKDIIYSCHQPNFLPWIGYFHKIINSDIFILLDNVQYTKNSVANRNKLKGLQGEQFITVPISKRISNSSFFSYNEAVFAQKKWYEKPIKTITQNYSKSKHFEKYKNVIFDILMMDNFCEMNISFIKFIIKEYKIETEILLMSQIDKMDCNKNDLLISIGKYLNANIYLSGNGARSYNDEKKFNENAIKIIYQEFEHPIYNQLYSPFTPFLSILDLLFNEGEKGKYFLLEQNFKAEL